MQQPRSRWAVGLLALVTAATVVAATASDTQPALSTTGDLGIRGPATTGAPYSPTSDKPQSKLWWNDGTWWGDLFDSASRTWRIFRLDQDGQAWTNTGVAIDDRPDTLADVLWDGSHLYVASHVVTISSNSSVHLSQPASPARLYRYSYDPSQRTYSLDAGFPAQITDWSSESITLAKDSAGTLWATWTQVASSGGSYVGTVHVNATTGADNAWGSPGPLPVSGTTTSPDDISAVVAFGRTRIGVLWSNQRDDTVYWATHRDGTGRDVWTVAPAVRDNRYPDDHLNLKSVDADDTGRVVAVVKTSFDGLVAPAPTLPQLELLVFRPTTAAWSRSTVGTLADCHTRPIVQLDEERALVRVYATAPSSGGCPYPGAPGTIYEKTASLSDPVFGPGRGTPVLRDAASPYMNDATSSKGGTTSASGLVVMANNPQTGYYWFARTVAPAPSPSASPSASGAASPSASGAASPSASPVDSAVPSPPPTLDPGNLLTLSSQSLEDGVSSWTTLSGATMTATATCYDGAQAASVTLQQSRTVSVIKASRVPGTPKTTYTFVTYLRTDIPLRFGKARLDFYDSSNRWISGVTGVSSALTTGGWTRVTVTGTAPRRTASVLPILDYSRGQSGESFAFDHNVLSAS